MSKIWAQWAAWKKLNARYRSYVWYGLVAALLLPIIMWVAVDMDDPQCLRLAVADISAETMANLAIPECDSRPFSVLVSTFGAQGAGPVDVPSYEESLKITPTSARVWTVVFAALIGATVASSVAGVALVFVGSREDANRSGWAWGFGLSLLGLALAVGLTELGSAAIFEATFIAPDGTRHVVDYSQLAGSFNKFAVAITLIGGAAMVAAVVAVGHKVSEKSRSRTCPLTIAELDRSSTTVRILLLALAASLSIGVLSASARIRLIEHLPGAGDVPNEVSILYGSLFTLLIAALAVPTNTRLSVARERILSRMAGDDLDPPAVARRQALREELEMMTGPAGALGTSLTVLGPFATAAASAVLS